MLLIGAAAVIPDCAKIPELHEQEAEPYCRVSLSVEEARRYFESEYRTLSVTKTVNGEARVPWLMPGDITPMWEKAVESGKGNTASVDVEVIPTYRYRAVRSEFRNGKAEAYTVGVCQKLVVVKKYDEKCGEYRMGQYILTLIPDRGYDRSHRGNVAGMFINTGDKGSYSGLAVYFCGGIPMRLDRYEDGEKMGWISAFGTGDAEEFARRVNMICRVLGQIKFLRGNAVQSKFGEDFWDDDSLYGGELDPSIVYGGGSDSGNDDSIYGGELDPSVSYGENQDFSDPYDTDDSEDLYWPPMDTGDEDDEWTLDDDWDWGWSPDDGSGNNQDKPEGGEDDEEAIALGRQGVSKMVGDLRSGNVNVMQATINGLSGLSLGVNTYSIFTSVANCLEGAASDKLLTSFGNKLGAAGITITAAQTFMVLIDEGELSTSEWLSIISSALGGAAIVCGSFAAPVAGILGVTSALVGIASFFVSDNIAPGWYEIMAPNGEIAYICVGSSLA